VNAAPRTDPADARTAALDRPLVLVPADNRMLGEHPYHVAGKKYVDAVRLAGCLPLVVPAAGADEVDELLSLADGVLLTGSPSNVDPSLFGQPVHDPSLPLDPQRDEWTLPLTRRALELGVPLFAICRGFQETNVALGGTLHQAVQEQPGKNDHRAPPDSPPEVQYGLAHDVHVLEGGLLESILGAVQLLLLPDSAITSRYSTSFGIGRFLDPATTSDFVLGALGRVDVFTLWVTALLAIGIGVMGKLTAGRAAAVGAMMWLVGLAPLLLGLLQGG